MTEEEARDWILGRHGGAKLATLERFVGLLVAESGRQNLIAPSTLGTIWNRHIVDSAQLLPLAGGVAGTWIDVGSGAGLPGVVIAILRDDPMILVESRRRRCEFLTDCVAALDLTKTEVRCCRVEVIKDRASVISARAVAAIEQIFTAASAYADPDTMWILPRGKSGAEELVQAQKSWHGTFHVEQSLTHPESQIVTARGASRR